MTRLQQRAFNPKITSVKPTKIMLPYNVYLGDSCYQDLPNFGSSYSNYSMNCTVIHLLTYTKKVIMSISNAHGEEKNIFYLSLYLHSTLHSDSSIIVTQ